MEDDSGSALSTGDIVMTYTISKTFGVADIASLSVVTANHYANFQGIDPVKLPKEEQSKPFVMGIASCDIKEPEEDYPETVWRVRRLKKFEDVIDGERWREWGFSYKEMEE
jgi:hypothetical protein